MLKLDQQTHTATLVTQYGARRNLNSDYMGDTQLLANGNVMVGWGSEPYFSEYSRSGKLLLDAVLPRLGPDLPGHGRALGRRYRSTPRSAPRGAGAA